MKLGRAGILRGDQWAVRLQEALADQTGDTVNWMARHTQILKGDQYSRVGLLELDGELCYLKFYRQKSIFQQLFFWLGRGRGVHAFDAADKLAELGIPVPVARACLLLPDGMLLLTEGLGAARDLKATWQDELPGGERNILMASAGRALGDLHRQAFAHGDCKWSNLLLKDGQVYLVDLEDAGKVVTGDRRQARDLARFTANAEDLGVSELEFKPFMQAYSQQLEMPPEVIVDRMMSDLRRYRARHREKYGERGAPLF